MNYKTFRIGKRKISSKSKPYIIAEVAQAHDGSLGMAHSFIDSLRDTGVDAVKFQAHIANKESTKNERFRVQLSTQDKSRFEYWKRMEFSEEMLIELKQHCESEGMDFLCSPFSLEAFDILMNMNVAAIKLGSAEALWPLMIQHASRANIPLIISTGLCNIKEIVNLRDFLVNNNNQFCLLHCYSEYPTKLENINLSFLEYLKNDIHEFIGFSDHSGSIWPGLKAISLGAQIVEVHVKLSKGAYGPDSSSSLLPHELSELCAARDAFFTLDQVKVSKNQSVNKLIKTKSLFSRSLALCNDFPKGTVISDEMIVEKKPGNGIPLDQRSSIIGLKLARDYSSEYLLTPSDLK